MMKSSMRLCSLGSTQWSGLKVPAAPSPRGTWQAIRVARSSVRNLVMALAPDFPARSAAQLSSTPQASGVTRPRPVTTTRRMQAGQALALSIYLTASPTVTMDSAASSGISMPNSSSNAMTSSTVSRLSAPRSSIKDALSVTLSASTFRCSTTIFFTRSAVSLIDCKPLLRFQIRPEKCAGKSLAVTQGWFADGGFVTQSPTARYIPLKPLKLLSQHCHSAIDMQGLPGHIGCLLRGQVDHGSGDFLGRAHAPQRDAGSDHLFLLVGEHVGHRGLDEPRR